MGVSRSGASSPSLNEYLACSGVSEDSSIAWDCVEVLMGDGPLKTSFKTEEVKRGDGEKRGVTSVGGTSGIKIVGVAPVRVAGVAESTVS